MRLKPIFASVLMLWVTLAHASLPVIDWVSIQNLLKNYRVLKQQLSALQQQYQIDVKQAGLLSGIQQAMVGHFGYGALLDDQSHFQERLWSPSDWQAALKGLAGGNPQRYQQLFQLYQQQHPQLTAQQRKLGSNAFDSDVQLRDQASNRAAVVNASYAYDTLRQHMSHIHSLAAQIDQTVNAKAALDLNSRLVAEVAYLHTEELKMQVFLNQQLAQRQSDQLDYRRQQVIYNAHALEDSQ